MHLVHYCQMFIDFILMEKFFAIITSSTFWKHLGAMAGIFIVLLFIVSISLNIYIDHGEKMPVPDFVGLHIEKATEIADAVDLTLQIIDSVYDTDSQPGVIISHSPAAGYNVKAGRTVFVVINSINPEMISMPDLKNMSLRQAKEQLKIFGLELGKVSYSPDFAKDYVLEQNYKGRKIAKGTRIAKRSKVDLVLGLGDSGADVLMPNLVGMTYSEAISEIRSNSLNLGGAMFPEGISTKDSLNAIVVRQSPEFESGKSVKTGILVDIWLQSDSTSSK